MTDKQLGGGLGGEGALSLSPEGGNEVLDIAVGAAKWVIANVTGQLEVIVGHVRRHEALLERLGSTERAAVDQASATLRKARQAVPVAFGRRKDRPS
jgi:hypothetical protein